MYYQEPKQLETSPVAPFPEGSIPRIFQLVERLNRKLKGIQRRTVRVTGLTPPQYVVLGALALRDRRPLSELADVAHCTRATITGIVDVLEGKGLVTREVNPDDRRSLLVSLTAEGRALEELTPSVNDMLLGCCVGLSPDEAGALTDLLSKLDGSLDSWEGAS